MNLENCYNGNIRRVILEGDSSVMKTKELQAKERAKIAVQILENRYPEAICSLDYEDPFRLMVSVRLSAQCTDERVNLITPELFKRYPTITDFTEADQEELEKYIFSCGFYHSKAKDIIGAAKAVNERFGGKVPDDMEQLLSIPGVGRKSANLLLGDIYGKPAVVADTHCIRISNRLGLCETTDPYKVEMALKAILPTEKSNDFCHRLVLFGREICTARSPKCSECPLAGICLNKPQQEKSDRIKKGRTK